MHATTARRMVGPVVWLLVVGLGLVAFSPGAAHGAGVDVAQAQKAVSAAAARVAKISDSIAESNKAAQQAGSKLAAINVQLSAAKVERKKASVAEDRAGQVALRSSQDAEAVQERANGARGAVMRLARDSYANAMVSNDLMMFTGFFADGSASLGDISQQLLATNRVQERLVWEADQTARQAEMTRQVADGAAQDHGIAASRRQSAADAVVKLKNSASATNVQLGVAKDRAKVWGKRLKRAQAAYANAQEGFKKAFLSACLAGGVSAAPSLPPASSGNQAPKVWNELLANGFTQEAAAGILGNLQQESNVDPTVMQNGGPGMGLAQWSQGGRWDNGSRSMLAFAGIRGLDPWAAQTQVQFMLYEMSGSWGEFDLEAFRKMTDIAAATVYFHDVFERSSDSGVFVNTIRVGYAQAWYAKLSSGSEAAESKSAGPAPVVLSCPGE